jgi:hypothetical protein
MLGKSTAHELAQIAKQAGALILGGRLELSRKVWFAPTTLQRIGNQTNGLGGAKIRSLLWR